MQLTEQNGGKNGGLQRQGEYVARDGVKISRTFNKSVSKDKALPIFSQFVLYKMAKLIKIKIE